MVRSSARAKIADSNAFSDHPGIGPSHRLQVLLQMNSTVFIPDMHIPNWPMALIKPYVHYVPVARNLR